MTIGSWSRLVTQALSAKPARLSILLGILAVYLCVDLTLAAWQFGGDGTTPVVTSRDAWVVLLIVMAHLPLWLAAVAFAIAVARELRNGGDRLQCSSPSMSASKEAPAIVDRLVTEQTLTAGFLRVTARDGVHAITTPLATIKTSLQTLRRSVPADDRRALRALEIVDLASDELNRLTRSSWARLEEIADILGQDRRPADALKTVRDHVDILSDTTVVELTASPSGPVVVAAPPGILETLVEAVLQLAIEMSGSYRGYSVMLTTLEDIACFRVESLDELGIERAWHSEDLDRDWRILRIRYLVAVLGGRLSLTMPPVSARCVIVVGLPLA